jgi:RNA polymerase sigma-70 factor (ECF subfamily)
VAERSNEEWIAALSRPGAEHDAALEDLRLLLVRGLGYALSQRRGIDDALLDDFAQDALLRILDGLNSFRGESRFTTWAQKIAVRVAYTELRRHRWRDVSLDDLTDTPDADFVPSFMADPSVGPEQQAIQHAALETVRRVIDEDLTDKQRQALVAKIQGMPLEEVARRMGSNRNALYKLLYDARQALKHGLLAEGLTAEEILAAFEQR